MYLRYFLIVTRTIYNNIVLHFQVFLLTNKNTAIHSFNFKAIKL